MMQDSDAVTASSSGASPGDAAASPDAPPVLRARQLGMRYAGPEGAVTLFTGLDLTIAAGESVAILGASGSGKSTLLGLLAGLEQPSEGQIWLADAELTALDEDGRAAVRGSVLGFIFQAFHLLPGLTAVENVRLALELTGGGRGSAAAAQHALERVGLGGRLRHTPERLSGGEQQRVAIARAIVTAPQVVMADEPTGNLDDATGKEIIDLLFTLNHEQGTTLVIVTHDPRVAERCQRVCHFRDGGLHE